MVIHFRPNRSFQVHRQGVVAELKRFDSLFGLHQDFAKTVHFFVLRLVLFLFPRQRFAEDGVVLPHDLELLLGGFHFLPSPSFP